MNKDPPDRFLCMLALETLATFDAPALMERLGRDFPKAALSGTGKSIGDAVSVLDFEDATALIAANDFPVPSGMLERAYILNRHWPEARSVLASHRAHLVVSNGEVANDFNDAIFAAALVTLVAASLSEMVPCTALYWATSETLHRPGDFRRYAEPVQSGHRAAAIWTQLQMLEGPRTTSGEATVTGVSFGMRPFIGREIELAPTTLPHLEAGKRLIGAIDMSLTRGPVLKDGDTFGLTADERISAEFRQSAVRPGLPVVCLNAESAKAGVV